MTEARREIGLARLVFWHVKLLLAKLRGSRGPRSWFGGQTTVLTFLGIFWITFLGFSAYSGLDQALRRSPNATWLPELLLHTSWLGSLAMTLFFNVGFLLHVLFFSPDLSFLMSAPVSPHKVLTVRFLQAMWANLFFSLCLSLPTAVAVGVRVAAGPLFYLSYALCLIGFLAFPVAMTYYIGIPLARWVSTARLRAIFSVFGFVIALGLWSLPYMAPGRITSYRQWSDLLRKGEAVHSFFGTLQARFLPSTWVSDTLVHAARGDHPGTWLRLLALLAGALILAVGAVRLGSRFYLAGWIRMVPIGETQPVRSERFTFLLGWLPPRWRPIFWKDISIITRDFRVSFQLYSTAILMCLLPLLTLVAQSGSVPDAARPIVSLASALGASVVVASQAGMMVVPLEGRAGFRLLAAPLTAFEIAATKCLVAILLTLPIVAAQLVVISLGFGRPASEALFGGVLSLAGAFLGAGFGVFMGAAFGNFDWDHPRKMVRWGAQLGWGIGVGAIVVGLTIVIQVGVVISENVMPLILRPALPVVALAGAALAASLSVSFAARRIAKLEWY